MTREEEVRLARFLAEAHMRANALGNMISPEWQYNRLAEHVKTAWLALDESVRFVSKDNGRRLRETYGEEESAVIQEEALKKAEEAFPHGRTHGDDGAAPCVGVSRFRGHQRVGG